MTDTIGAGVWTAPSWSRERDEDGRSLGHRIWNALPTLEAGLDQVPGVSSIDGGTGRTADRAPSAAGLENDTVGERCAGEDTATTIGDRDCVAPQSDRMATPSAAGALSEEVIDLMTAPVASECFEHGVVRGIHGREGGSRV